METKTGVFDIPFFGMGALYINLISKLYTFCKVFVRKIIRFYAPLFIGMVQLFSLQFIRIIITYDQHDKLSGQFLLRNETHILCIAHFFTFPFSTFFIVMETMVFSERETCGVFITSNFSYIDKSFSNRNETL